MSPQLEAILKQAQGLSQEEQRELIQQLTGQVVSTQLEAQAKPKVLTQEVSNNPWTDFIGMFEGDNEFAELAAELRAERKLDV